MAVTFAVSAQIAARQAAAEAAVVSKSFVIDKIDSATRTVTLRDAEGISETLVVGPAVDRFNALKVGDKVTFRYYESVAYQIRRSDAQPGAPAPGTAATAGLVRNPGDRPGGTISQQLTATVTVNAIDMKIPSVTVTGPEKNKMTLKVADAKNLEGLKPGDRVDITYTQALAVDVTPPDK
jgi:Cu/Ag efflux protein CusF